ncbi:hypothetical protein NPIL_189221 [Nephila pilipes]|uniref:Uncharacterized protein n=1 Tax=Nephila pilipes TaxID=299642 RepID=A0A8X6UEM6_NEPPI|nr:hypothetical protein NPIL_519631 [Nephila pilipes]GFU09341.1 hypothetical protein NPIL_189221 [Nephila pilipes]
MLFSSGNKVFNHISGGLSSSPPGRQFSFISVGGRSLCNFFPKINPKLTFWFRSGEFRGHGIHPMASVSRSSLMSFDQSVQELSSINKNKIYIHLQNVLHKVLRPHLDVFDRALVLCVGGVRFINHSSLYNPTGLYRNSHITVMFELGFRIPDSI